MNTLVPQCTGFVSKLMKNTAWVRLNYTTEHFSDEQLERKAKLFLMSELVTAGRSEEAKDFDKKWTVDRIKADVPLFGRNTALVYMKRVP